MHERPDISRMVQEELDKADALPESGVRPVDLSAREERLHDLITDTLKADQTEQKLRRAADSAAREVQLALESGDARAMQSAADLFLENVQRAGGTAEQAIGALKAQLQAFHDSYKLAGLDAKAAEIRAFADALSQSTEVRTEVGRGFIAALESGAYADLEAAMNALEDAKDKALATGVSEEALNAEFNLLYAAASRKFEGRKTAGGTDAFNDGDIDDLLGGFGGAKDDGKAA